MRKGCGVVAEGEVGAGPAQARSPIEVAEEDRKVQMYLFAGCQDPVAVPRLLGMLLWLGSEPLEGLQSIARAQVGGERGAAGRGLAGEAEQDV